MGTFNGMSGDDRLSSPGADSSGNDSLYGPGGGYDAIQSTIGRTLPLNIEAPYLGGVTKLGGTARGLRSPGRRALAEGCGR